VGDVGSSKKITMGQLAYQQASAAEMGGASEIKKENETKPESNRKTKLITIMKWNQREVRSGCKQNRE
jgi:hypothetical protein